MHRKRGNNHTENQRCRDLVSNLLNQAGIPRKDAIFDQVVLRVRCKSVEDMRQFPCIVEEMISDDLIQAMSFPKSTKGIRRVIYFVLPKAGKLHVALQKLRDENVEARVMPPRVHEERRAPYRVQAESRAPYRTYAEARPHYRTREEITANYRAHEEAGARYRTHECIRAPYRTYEEAGAPYRTHAEARARARLPSNNLESRKVLMRGLVLHLLSRVEED